MKKTTNEIILSPSQREQMHTALKGYFLDELEMPIGDLQLDLFTDFLAAHVGKEFYNQGVTDTIHQLKDKTDDLLLLLKD